MTFEQIYYVEEKSVFPLVKSHCHVWNVLWSYDFWCILKVRKMYLICIVATTSVHVTHATATETETMNLSFDSYVFAVFQLIFFSFIGNILMQINHTVACIFDIFIFWVTLQTKHKFNRLLNCINISEFHTWYHNCIK